MKTSQGATGFQLDRFSFVAAVGPSISVLSIGLSTVGSTAVQSASSLDHN
jgi:hypothetical protein